MKTLYGMVLLLSLVLIGGASFPIFSFSQTSLPDGLTENLAMALMQDRTEGYEDGEGPKFKGTINKVNSDIGRNLSDIEIQIQLVIAQDYLEQSNSSNSTQ